MQAELRVARRRRRGLDAVIVRPPWFYGPFQPPRQTTFFRMVRTGRFPVIGDGHQRRSMVTSTTSSTAWCAPSSTADRAGARLVDRRRPAVRGRTRSSRPSAGRSRAEGFDVAPEPRCGCRPSPAALAERADRCIQRTGRYLQQVHVLGEMDKTIACDISVARAELGYEPTVELDEGMRRSIRWCVDQGLEL